MQMLDALRVIALDLRDDCKFWIKHRTLRPDMRRFLLLQWGRIKLASYQLLVLSLPQSLLHFFSARFIQSADLFDAEFYLQMNADVAEAGYDPLQHYLKYGDKEGRNPMPLFDPSFYRAKAGKSSHHINSLLHYQWIGCHCHTSPSAWFDAQYYTQHNRDVARRGFDPLQHYLKWGGLEGRSPNPSFNGSFYLRSNPDVKAAKINPLLHYIKQGRFEGRHTRPLGNDFGAEQDATLSYEVPLENIWAPGKWDQLEAVLDLNNSSPLVTVVIPVFRDRGLTWRCLASVLTAKCKTSFRLLVIDDESPEMELSADLAKMAKRGWIDLYINPRNLGFVASVNQAIQIAGEQDVVLLNSDTEVYPGWLDRLRNAAYRHPRTASVTPFSNNATIASYPRFLHDNPYPLEIDYPSLDLLAARVNAGVEVEVPTGVGFCMYLRHNALEQVGLFDEDAFGKGYGEENDWCQRAIHKGWRNIIATDTFVRHFGSASFQGEKAQRVAAAMRVIKTRHPSYHQQVQAFISQDSLYTSRERIDWARLQNQTQAENVLIICHNRGGGAERHVQEDSRRLLDEGKGVFYLRPVHNNPSQVRFAHPRCRQLLHSPAYSIADTQGLVGALRQLRITSLHLHGLVDMIPEAAAYLKDVARQLEVPLDVDIHDYKVICPRINLVDQNGFYCGEPDDNSCNTCLTTRGNDFGVKRIRPWRDMHHKLLREARNVWVPNEDVAERLIRYFPDLNVHVEPHDSIGSGTLKNYKALQVDKPMHIVVIGAISKIKGYEILLACAKEARRKRLPVRFSVLGYSMNDAPLQAAGVQITGRYQESEVEVRLHSLEPDVVWLPAIWPETFSYTLSIALRAGYPTFVYDIGAPAKRLRHLGLDNWVLPYELAFSAVATLNTLLESSRLRAFVK